MSPQQQADAILAKADATDELVLKLAQDREALLENARIVLRGFGQNVFVRNTDGDHESGWSLKLLPYITALARLEVACKQAEAK